MSIRCGHDHSERNTIRAYRLLLAIEAGRVDAIAQICDEIDAVGGCTGCMLVATQGIALNWLEDRFTTPDSAVDVNATVAHIADELVGELDRIDYEREL